MSVSVDLVREFRRLLTELVVSRRETKDVQEEVHDRVAAKMRALPRVPGMLAALDAAIGRDAKRREEAVYLLSELADIPEVVERIGVWLQDPNPSFRRWLVQTVEHGRLTQFAPALSAIIESDADPVCRQFAIHAAGTLRLESSLPSLLRASHTEAKDNRWVLVWAFKEFAAPECMPYLREVFGNQSEPSSQRVVAAWGLAKAGDEAAHKYLEEMLDDPDTRTPNSFTPGQSLRAAQALSDLHGWPFHWHVRSVGVTRRRLSANKAN